MEIPAWYFLAIPVGAVVVGSIAHMKGHNGFMWAIAGAVFGIFALAVIAFAPADRSELRRREISERVSRECPHCKDAIPRTASVCRSCGRDVAPVPEASAEY